MKNMARKFLLLFTVVVVLTSLLSVSASALSVDDFVKKSQFLYYTPSALNAVAEDVARFARKEGLEAHARSALARK